MVESNKFYVSNKQLYQALVEYNKKYKETGQKHPFSDYIGKCILAIATKLANKPNYISYTYKEEMISDGIENTVMYLHNFDPEKSNNAFAYITQIIKFSFHRRILKEKKQQYIKLKNASNFLSMDVNNEYGNNSLFEESYIYIKDYENFMEERKKKVKKIGIEKFFEEKE